MSDGPRAGDRLAWLREHEPELADRTAAVALPHDWLTWRLRGTGALEELVTDRSDASGTGYWSPPTGAYLPDVVRGVLGHDVLLPPGAGPRGGRGHGSRAGARHTPGTGRVDRLPAGRCPV
ncbi:FGGY family carbohydrate kinase [Ornithinimicrobium pratense]|uniref:Carbohydrate kinase FGGY N-terminal domain-containing protein n=1 Tax=Ornithinimicrobium pratense TaxID=2593973 RepID=A0A5J6V9L6_9MICO|nr:hypothetical protein FY030_06705 [Ornithinimicrobium pratense]